MTTLTTLLCTLAAIFSLAALAVRIGHKRPKVTLVPPSPLILEYPQQAVARAPHLDSVVVTGHEVQLTLTGSSVESAQVFSAAAQMYCGHKVHITIEGVE